jgi:hypothetical protein
LLSRSRRWLELMTRSRIDSPTTAFASGLGSRRGIGVVEAALMAALTTAGVPASGATTAVLVYRLISF